MERSKNIVLNSLTAIMAPIPTVAPMERGPSSISTVADSSVTETIDISSITFNSGSSSTNTATAGDSGNGRTIISSPDQTASQGMRPSTTNATGTHAISNNTTPIAPSQDSNSYINPDGPIASAIRAAPRSEPALRKLLAEGVLGQRDKNGLSIAHNLALIANTEPDTVTQFEKQQLSENPPLKVDPAEHKLRVEVGRKYVIIDLVDALSGAKGVSQGGAGHCAFASLERGMFKHYPAEATRLAQEWWRYGEATLGDGEKLKAAPYAFYLNTENTKSTVDQAFQGALAQRYGIGDGNGALSTGIERAMESLIGKPAETYLYAPNTKDTLAKLRHPEKLPENVVTDLNKQREAAGLPKLSKDEIVMRATELREGVPRFSLDEEQMMDRLRSGKFAIAEIYLGRKLSGGTDRHAVFVEGVRADPDHKGREQILVHDSNMFLCQGTPVEQELRKLGGKVVDSPMNTVAYDKPHFLKLLQSITIEGGEAGVRRDVHPSALFTEK